MEGTEHTSVRSGLDPARPAKRKVRVLFVNDTTRNGGPGQSLYTILRFLDTSVVHRSVLVPREGVIAERLRAGKVVDDLTYLPNLVENPFEPWDRAIEREDFDAPGALKAIRLAGNVGRGALGLAQLASIVRRGGYDLIYCNGTTANFAGAAVARMTGVPALWHARYTSIAKPILGLHNRLARSPSVRRVICVSHASKRVFEAANAAEKVRVINNAVDTEEFAPDATRNRLKDELRLAPDTVMFGSHGRVLRPKGYPEMIRAAHLALSQMTHDERRRAHFCIVGDTPADFRVDHLAECRALAAELGITDKVHLLGFRKDVRDMVDGFDVAMVPSIYPDPLPRSVLESMALAKPVIAFAVGGVPEMVEQDVSGTLLPLEPPPSGALPDQSPVIDALAEQILRYLRDPDLRKRQGAAARARIEAKFGGRAHSRAVQNEIVWASGLSVAASAPTAGG